MLGIDSDVALDGLAGECAERDCLLICNLLGVFGKMEWYADVQEMVIDFGFLGFHSLLSESHCSRFLHFFDCFGVLYIARLIYAAREARDPFPAQKMPSAFGYCMALHAH